ncbi:hypothetical protein [Vibrio rotiferianus]|uniref:hypothetical protein n=1 Tax=Vibrio rotiferianus TaxID=190895 RepID=UPI00397EBB06
MGVQIIKTGSFAKRDPKIHVIQDGITIHSEKAFLLEENQFEITNPNMNVLGAILSTKVSELPINLNVIEIPTTNRSKYFDWVTFRIEESPYTLDLVFDMTISLTEWDNPFTISELVDYTNGNTLLSAVIEDGFAFITGAGSLNKNETLDEQFNEILTDLEKEYSYVLKELYELHRKKNILRVFKFPDTYQSICSQYLIWFGEFLESFGINALISVNHEGDKTQVVLSSEHTEQMFQEIESLFSQYIALPYAELLPATKPLEPQQQFMITQLQSQVTMFKTQLEMKSSALQHKEATIQSLNRDIQGLERDIGSKQNIIDVQKNQLLLLESMQGGDELELFDGAIKLGDIEWGPIKISPKKILDKTKY